ncbi:hypothetical protein B0H13DRAFT_2231807 [Mycena leptocephala]|nr:hypothetical protein B0H13DRAFT_2231807 [Mycena leptocephala]
MRRRSPPHTVDMLGRRRTRGRRSGGARSPAVDPRPLVDAHGRIFAVLICGICGGSVRCHSSRRYCSTVPGVDAPAPTRSICAINVGLSYGKGQTTPTWLHNDDYDALADRLLANEHLNRLAHSPAVPAFALWAPRLYQYYHDHDKRLRKRFPHLGRPFVKSVFSCVAINFGPDVWTFRHRDVLNLPFGWCAIQSLGKFDPTKGGHLVLWDLKMVIEFPPGALVLIPSATLSHSNIPVAVGDHRASFTQFTAGGIFAEFEREDSDGYAEAMASKDQRWEMGLNLWTTIDEIAE